MSAENLIFSRDVARHAEKTIPWIVSMLESVGGETVTAPDLDWVISNRVRRSDYDKWKGDQKLAAIAHWMIEDWFRQKLHLSEEQMQDKIRQDIVKGRGLIRTDDYVLRTSPSARVLVNRRGFGKKMGDNVGEPSMVFDLNSDHGMRAIMMADVSLTKPSQEGSGITRLWGEYMYRSYHLRSALSQYYDVSVDNVVHVIACWEESIHLDNKPIKDFLTYGGVMMVLPIEKSSDMETWVGEVEKRYRNWGNF